MIRHSCIPEHAILFLAQDDRQGREREQEYNAARMDK